MRSLLGSIIILLFAFGCGKKAADSPEQLGVGPESPQTPVPPMPTENKFTNDINMQFVRVPKGTLWSPWGRQDIPTDFYIGVYEVTQEEWLAVTRKNPSYFCSTGKGAAQLRDIPQEELRRFPVDSISWQDAQNFVTQLNSKHGISGWRYRLPTQNEWEYAARGAEQDKEKAQQFFHFRSGPTNKLTTRQANFGKLDWLRLENVPGCIGRTCRVGSYEPNQLGLYDVHGNVWEWCEDIHTPPSQDRVQCGGAYISKDSECSAGNRGRGDHTIRAGSDDGLRVVLAPATSVSMPPNTKSDPKPVVKSDPELSKLTALGLVNLLKADKKAENRYRNKSFQIEGTVAKLDAEHNIATLTGSKLASVLCFFIGGSQDDFGRLKVGQKVTVKGILSGTNAAGDAQLLKCEVVK